MPENAAPKHLMMAAENLCIAGATLPSVSNWRTATVADLVRGSMLSLHRRWSFVSPSRDGSTALAQACPLKLQLTSEPADGDASGGRAVLTARDLATRAAPSGSAGDRSEQLEEEIEVERGDVILTNIVSGPLVVRVADSCDAGALLGANLVLLRPHARHLDSEFLAGVLAAPAT